MNDLKPGWSVGALYHRHVGKTKTEIVMGAISRLMGWNTDDVMPPISVIEHDELDDRDGCSADHADEMSDDADPVATLSSGAEPESLVGHFDGPEDLDRICAVLEEATEISIDLESTHLTPWSAPLPAGKSTKLGTGETLSKYVNVRPGCIVTERPRVRIVALETDNGLVAAVDLDLLDKPAQERLIRATAHPGAVWVGHNLGFDLAWLNHICPGVRPSRIIDTMLMTTALKSDIEYDVIQRVTDSPGEAGVIEDMRKSVMKRVTRSAGTGTDDAGAVSLDLLALHYLDQKLDKAFQKPINWMPSILSPGHKNYVLGDIKSPRLIARRMLGLPDNTRISDVISAIDGHPGGAAYKIFEAALPRLVQMQAQGIRIDPVAAGDYRSKLVDQLESAVTELVTLAPNLIEYKDILLDPSRGLTAELKAAVGLAFETATGKPPEQTKNGDAKLSAKDLKIHYGDAPVVAAWLKAQAPGKTIAMLDEYVARRDENDRLHSLTSISTLTGRTSSQEPNLQNMPRDPEFRAVFRAVRDAIDEALGIKTKILAIDFSAVEMRIAACLALRAYSAVVRSNFQLPKWVLKSAPGAVHDILSAIRAGRPAMPLVPPSWPLPEPCHGEAGPEAYGAWYASRFAIVLARLQAAGCSLKPDAASLLADRHKMALAGAFHRGLDPHLITGIQTEARAGRFDLDGKINALAFVESISPDERKKLKSEMKKPRTSAKALNFGLLYGMSAGGLHAHGIVNYGLDWTLDEAALARAAWFELYPEIELWHIYLKLYEKNEKRPVKKMGKITAEGGAKLYRHSTLSGRPVCGPEMRNAGNYADQGTGAEIALSAINDLSEKAMRYLVNFVHDEIVFEVPEDEAEAVAAEVEAVMNNAADRYFSKYGVPSEVEAAIGDFWIH